MLNIVNNHQRSMYVKCLSFSFFSRLRVFVTILAVLQPPFTSGDDKFNVGIPALGASPNNNTPSPLSNGVSIPALSPECQSNNQQLVQDVTELPLLKVECRCAGPEFHDIPDYLPEGLVAL